MRIRPFAVLFAASLTLIAAHAAFQPGAAAEQPTAPAEAALGIGSVAFLAGTWRGDHGGDLLEETWSRPEGDHILGMFRWMSAERKPGMLELLSIAREGEDIVLRLRHFSAQMQPWASEAKGPITLRLDRAEATRAEFVATAEERQLAGVVYEVTGDELKVTITFPEAMGREPLVLVMKRVP